MSRMYLAAAGSGKTTFLLEKTSDKSKRYLYTTFTDENAENARDMLIKKYGCVPSNVTILPWFSFLLEHGVRPFQGAAGFKDMQFTGIQIKPEGRNYYKQPALRHYCNSSNAIYAAKLPELALLCNKQSGGAVLNRLQRIFDAVLIDEVQDMAGYDYEFCRKYSLAATPSALKRHIRTNATANGYSIPHNDSIRSPAYPRANQVPHKKLGPPSSGIRQQITKVKKNDIATYNRPPRHQDNS